MIRSYSYSKTPDLFIHLPLQHGIKMHNIWPRWHTHFQMLFIAFAGQPLNQQTQQDRLNEILRGRCANDSSSAPYFHRKRFSPSHIHVWYQIRYQNGLKCCNLSRFQHLETGFKSSLECKAGSVFMNMHKILFMENFRILEVGPIDH